MLPSTQNAGLSLAGPVAVFVTVTVQMSAFVALADRFEGDERRMFAGEVVQELGQLGMAVKAIEGDVWHRLSEAKKGRTRAQRWLRKCTNDVAIGAILRHRRSQPARALLGRCPPTAGEKSGNTVYLSGMASLDLLPAYAELHCLSNFSFLRGASHPEELVERAKAQGYAALALTDECSLAGAVRAHLAAKEVQGLDRSSGGDTSGLQLILGSE